MTEIAEFAMVQAPTLTKVVDRMVSANLVLRRVDDADRRRVLVFASDRGRQAVRQWTVLVKREHDDLVSAVGLEEINLLNALLVRVSGRLG
jgi:DNA-binding MarR family transcriptional regulator